MKLSLNKLLRNVGKLVHILTFYDFIKTFRGSRVADIRRQLHSFIKCHPGVCTLINLKKRETGQFLTETLVCFFHSQTPHSASIEIIIASSYI